VLYRKQAQKEARRPKFGKGDFRRGVDSPLPLGADIGRLSELLDAEARRPE